MEFSPIADQTVLRNYGVSFLFLYAKNWKFSKAILYSLLMEYTVMHNLQKILANE